MLLGGNSLEPTEPKGSLGPTEAKGLLDLKGLLDPKVTILSGGFGGARFVSSMDLVLDGACCIVNTGDDAIINGLRVSPDLDSVIYALQKQFDFERGYGIEGDTFIIEHLMPWGSLRWFNIGDRDFVTHCLRTRDLMRRQTLSDSTSKRMRHSKSQWIVIPMSNDKVVTEIQTPKGILGFQNFVVEHRGLPKIERVNYQGAQSAKPAPGVIESLQNADLVIVGPSSPVASIGPMLAISSLKEGLVQTQAPVIAITPVVIGQVPTTAPEKMRFELRSKLCKAQGIEHTPYGIAKHYLEFIDGFVLDERDIEFQGAIEDLGIRVLATNTLPERLREQDHYAKSVISFGTNLVRRNRQVRPDQIQLDFIG